MNHDYAHCLDYAPDCPKKCFRAKLTKEFMDNPTGIVSWMHFEGLEECEKNRRVKDAAD